MAPVVRFSSIALGVTVYVMFLMIPAVTSAIENHLTPDIVKLIPNGAKIYEALLGTAGALAVYKILMMALEWMLGRVQLVKKVVLGPAFVEGTWVGFYGTEDETFHFVDTYEQTLTKAFVKGVSYNASPTPPKPSPEVRATWVSTQVNIDAEHGTLDFHCNVTLPQENTSQTGVTEFNFVRDKVDSAPSKLNGQTGNLRSGNLRVIHAKKYSSKTNINELEALKAAIEYCKEWQEFNGG